MGTFRGVFTSVGAGVSLVIAGVLSLLLASTVVAFNGWPGLTHSSSSKPLQINLRLAKQGDRSSGHKARRVTLGGGKRVVIAYKVPAAHPAKATKRTRPVSRKPATSQSVAQVRKSGKTASDVSNRSRTVTESKPTATTPAAAIPTVALPVKTPDVKKTVGGVVDRVATGKVVELPKVPARSDDKLGQAVNQTLQNAQDGLNQTVNQVGGTLKSVLGGNGAGSK